MNVEDIKTQVKELKLNEKYWEILRKNSELLKKMHPDEGYYTEDGCFVDTYDPDAYSIRLFLIWKDNKMYIGNEQIPNTPDYNNHKRTSNLIEYWFRGDNCCYTILHEFVGVNNKSINAIGRGCNQNILAQIKREIIEQIKTNLNVQDIGDIEPDEIKDQYGKNISKYKKQVRNLLKNTTANEFCDIFVRILNDIYNNRIQWANFLYYKNRYTLISEYEEDILYKEEFLGKYGSLDEKYIAVLIIMKEYLLWQTSELLGNPSNYYKTIFSKRQYILNPKCTTADLYDWKKMWDNSKPIDIILGIQYKEVWEGEVVKQKGMYKKFRTNLYKNIYA